MKDIKQVYDQIELANEQVCSDKTEVERTSYFIRQNKKNPDSL